MFFFVVVVVLGFFIRIWDRGLFDRAQGEEGGEVEDIKELSYGTGDISGNRERVMTV